MGRRVDGLPSRQGRLAFAYLVLNRRRPVARDELAAAVWHEEAPSSIDELFASLLSRLRRALPAGALAGRRELMLQLGPAPWIDVEVVAAAPAEAARLLAHDPGSALRSAREGLEIVERPLLPGLDRPWLDEARRRLDDHRPRLLEALGRAALAAGEPLQAEAAARELLDREPLRESAHVLLMEIHAACGEDAEALRVYHELRALLGEQLGTVPSAPARELAERLLRGSTAERVATQGTLALLFTDIEGSTALARRLGPAWPDVLAEHHAIVEGAIERHGGHVDHTHGDAFFATFREAAAAARAATLALRELRAHAWPAATGEELRVRMGVHVGRVDRNPTGYVGLEVHRAARLAAAAHGGQLLLTRVAAELVGDAIEVEPLGAFRLTDFPEPEQLFCAVVDGRGAAAFPPPRTAEVRPTNLPASTTTLIGRDRDVERLRAALAVDRERLVTVTGRGGAGKTSLARAVAESLLDAYQGGVWWVPLAVLTDAGAVLAAVASATGAQHDARRPVLEAVVDHLRHGGPTLLVLDNLEHLASAAPDLSALLDALPQLHILATSQLPLGLPFELCLPLETLDEGAGLALIQHAATRAGATAGADAELLDVVRLLDGLPLGLELAAARLHILTPKQLRDRLAASTDVLSDHGAGRLERHRSLRATLDWTLGLLDDAPRTLFTRMGAFAGPVELEELEAVTAIDGLDVLAALAELVDVALVRRIESGDGRLRFGLPEAVRQLAAEQLDAAPDGARWRHAHAERQLEVVWEARHVLTTTMSTALRAVRATVEAEAALRWTRATGDPLAAPLAAALGAALVFQGRLRDVLTMVGPVLAEPPADPATLATAAWAEAYALHASGRTAEAVARADGLEGISEDSESDLNAVLLRGVLALQQGLVDESVALHQRATTMARSCPAAALARALVLEAHARRAAGELDRAAGLLDEGERVALDSDATALAALATFRAALALERGRPAEALEHYAQSLLEAERRGDALDVMWDLDGAATALGALGRDEDSLVVLGMLRGQAADLGAAPAIGPIAGGHHLAAAEAQLGPHAAAAAEARGRAVPRWQRVTTVCRIAHGSASDG